MSSLTESPQPTLEAVGSSHDSLKEILQPLFGHSFEKLSEDLLQGSSKGQQDNDNKDELSGRLDTARLEVSVAYVLLDLVWIYLKTKGIDPTTHPVIKELERVKGYFGKIKYVQNKEKQEVHAKLDKSAAGRFIRAALGSAVSSPQGKHTKFDDEDGHNKNEEQEVEEQITELQLPQSQSNPSERKKKGRKVLDPFEGYDKPSEKRKAEDAQSTTDANVHETEETSESPIKKKKKKKAKKTKQEEE